MGHDATAYNTGMVHIRGSAHPGGKMDAAHMPGKKHKKHAK
jgi:hypothetical protein